MGDFFRSDPEVFIILPSIRRVFKWEICLKSTKNPRKIKRKYYLPPPSNINLLSLEDRRLALNGHVLPKSEWNNLEDSDFVSDFSKSSLSSLVDDIFFCLQCHFKKCPKYSSSQFGCKSTFADQVIKSLLLFIKAEF